MTQWLAGRAETVTGILSAATADKGDAVYLDFRGETYSYGQIDEESDRLAFGLLDLGVGRGDTVASIIDNNVDAVVAWFAINKVGAISVPVNTAFKGEFLRHQIADSAARVVIAEEDYAERVLAVATELPKLAHLLHRGGGSTLTGASVNIQPLEHVKRDGDSSDLAVNEPGDLSMLIYTSGTTGPSKGCMISHGYACNLARQAIAALGYGPDDILWTALPLFHMNATATAVLATAIVGARAAVYSRFSLSGFWPDIERSGATVTSLLGSMHPLIAAAPDTDASIRCHGQLRTVGAAPFPQDLQDKWRSRFGVRFMGAPGYGLTEAAMMTTGPLAARIDPNSSGPVADEFEVVIVDDRDQQVEPGASGEVLCRPKRPFVMFSGYWNRPDDTLKIMSNLWLHTGDIGRIAENGEFYFVDRKKDYMRRRGENISSHEMEATFRNHPGIADVAVHAVFSKMGEDDVKVTAVLREGATMSEADLCTWCVDKVPFFAVPRYIEFRPDLPRNPTGKILKFQLRDEGRTETTWDREEVDFVIDRR